MALHSHDQLTCSLQRLLQSGTSHSCTAAWLPCCVQAAEGQTGPAQSHRASSGCVCPVCVVCVCPFVVAASSFNLDRSIPERNNLKQTDQHKQQQSTVNKQTKTTSHTLPHPAHAHFLLFASTAKPVSANNTTTAFSTNNCVLPHPAHARLLLHFPTGGQHCAPRTCVRE